MVGRGIGLGEAALIEEGTVHKGHCIVHKSLFQVFEKWRSHALCRHLNETGEVGFQQ